MKTTADCRDFIVKFVSDFPEVILSKWSEESDKNEIRKVLTKPAKWKRHAKWKATGANVFAESEYSAFHGKRIPAEKLSWVREFYLNPADFENAIGFQVLEDVDGNLILGEFIGD